MTPIGGINISSQRGVITGVKAGGPDKEDKPEKEINPSVLLQHMV